MDVRNHRISDIWYEGTSNLSSGTIEPKVLVTHYTTGWSGSGSRDWLLGAAGRTQNKSTSAHLIIDRDGTAWQIAPFNRRAWHAGPSRHGSLSDLNSHSIGFEFVGPGWLKPDAQGGWVDAFGNRRTTAQLEDFGGYIEKPHSRVGSGTLAWPLFTEPQLKTGLAIARALIAKYPIQAVVTHEEIDTRGWKTDPGPAFPQQIFVDLLDAQDIDPATIKYRVNTTRLNIRGGPGADFEKIDPPGHLPQGTTVSIVHRQGDWGFIQVEAVSTPIDGLARGLRGWAHCGYLDMIF